MGRLVITDKPKPRLEVVEPRTRRRITPNEIEKGLGAERVAKVPPGGSPMSAYALRQELFRRLRSTGGRPGLNGTDMKPKIPMRRSRWKKLEKLAKQVESDSFHPTPAQLASVILDAGIEQFEQALQLDHAEVERLDREIEREAKEIAPETNRGRGLAEEVGTFSTPAVDGDVRPESAKDRNDRVENLIDEAWHASTAAGRAKYARRALSRDPTAIDAYVALALSLKTLAEQIALLREAVRLGAVRFASELERPPEHFFWLELTTRPYMRAVHNLALALWQRGEQRGAALLADHLVRINPNDNQGARYLGLAWHPVLGNWSHVEQLLDRYDGEASTAYLYSRCLNSIRLDQSPAAVLAKAFSANPYVPALLLGGKPPSQMHDPQYLAVGSIEEAIAYAEDNRDAWNAVPKALKWLRETVSRGGA